MDVDTADKSLFEEEGSSLVTVLIIITILSLLIGSVMMGLMMQNRFVQRDADRLQARYSAEAGIFHFLSDTAFSNLLADDSLQVQLIDSTRHSIIDIRPFGGFLQITSTAQEGSQSKTIRTLAGEKASSPFQQAVVLGDIHSALNLTGNTNIEGDITTGPPGVRQRPFKGELFKGSLDGKINQEEKTFLPEFDKTLFDYEIAYCDSLLRHPPPEAIILDSGKIDLSRQLPEFGEPALFYTSGDLELTTSSLSAGGRTSSGAELPEAITLIVTGNLTIEGTVTYKPFSRFIAGKDLTVSGKPEGNHGLFYAGRELVIEGEKPLSGQFLAGENITVTGNMHLKYPSVAYLKGLTEQGVRKGRLELSGNSIVEGLLMIPAPEEVINEDDTRLVIGKGSGILGGIYNTGQTELHGKVSGSVLTLQFYFYHSPTAYINWLKDVSISLKDRPDNFVVPIGFAEKSKYELLTWQELPAENQRK
ncbi:MAG: PilX N-terminal domain-containing pilus assembly protein [Balneolaceae bacterium]